MSKKNLEKINYIKEVPEISVFIIQDHTNQTGRSAPSGSFKSKKNIGLLYRSTSI